MINIKNVSFAEILEKVGDKKSISTNNIFCLKWIYDHMDFWSNFFVGYSKAAHGCEDANKKRSITHLFSCSEPVSYDRIDKYNHELKGIFSHDIAYFLPGNFRINDFLVSPVSMRSGAHRNVNPFYPTFHQYQICWDVIWWDFIRSDDPFFVTTNLCKCNPASSGALFALFDPRDVFAALESDGINVMRSRIGLDPDTTSDWSYIYAKQDFLELAEAYALNPVKG